MRFKIEWATLLFGSKFTVVALFYFVFEGNFPSTSPRGAYIWRGNLTGVFFALPAYFRNFTAYFLTAKGTPFVYLPLKNDAFFAYLSNGRLGTNQTNACRHFYSNVREYQERGCRLLA